MADAAVKDAFVIDENENVFTSCLSEVDRHASFLTAFEDEVIGAEHSFLEPECGRDLVGAHLGFSTFNFPKCFSVDNFSCTFEDDDITIESDAVDSIPNVADRKNVDDLEGMLQGMGETVLNEPKRELGSSMEYFLDDLSACENPNLLYDALGNYRDANTGLDDKSPGMIGRDSNAAILHLSSENVASAVTKDDQNSASDKMTLEEFHNTCRNVLEQDIMVKDEQWPGHCFTFGFSNSTQLDGSSNLMRSESDMTSFEDEGSLSCRKSCGRISNDETKVDAETIGIGSDSPSLSSSVVSETGVDFQDKGDVTGPLVTGKRAHKPPRRYIEELLDVKSRYNYKKYGTSDRSSKPKCLSNRVHKQQNGKGNVVELSAEQVGSFNGACIQVPFGLPVEEEDIKDISCLGRQPDSRPCNQIILSNEQSLAIFPKKERSDPEYLSMDLQCLVSEDDHVRSTVQKSRRRRKHHMPWTLSEVMNLIEGVSRIGVGKWSKIKKLLFSSSKHRTSVDLKDKWRNLVKASCTQLRRKRKVLQGRKQLSHQAPESVLRRVRELSNFYT